MNTKRWWLLVGLAVTLLTQSVVYCGELPERARRYVAQATAASAERLKRLESQSKKLRAQAARGSGDARTQLQQVTAEMRALRTGRLTEPKLDLADLQLGQFGVIADEVMCVQVLDKTSMHVATVKREYYGYSGPYSGFRVDRPPPQQWVEVVGDRVLVCNVSTAGKTDGSKITLSEVFEVVGTDRYKTVDGGSNTIIVLDAVDMTTMPKQRPTKQVGAVAAAKKPRVWKDATGTFSVTATFAGCIAGNVRLTKKDGSTITIQMGRLSDADREWILKR